jgi:hypothetical protein
MNESKTEYEPVELGGIKTGDCIEGEIVCDADPGRGSVLINGKILTGEAFQKLLSQHEGFNIQFTIIEPCDP